MNLTKTQALSELKNLKTQKKLLKEILNDSKKQKVLTINGYMIFNISLQEMIKCKIYSIITQIDDMIVTLEKNI